MQIKSANAHLCVESVKNSVLKVPPIKFQYIVIGCKQNIALWADLLLFLNLKRCREDSVRERVYYA